MFCIRFKLGILNSILLFCLRGNCFPFCPWKSFRRYPRFGGSASSHSDPCTHVENLSLMYKWRKIIWSPEFRRYRNRPCPLQTLLFSCDCERPWPESIEWCIEGKLSRGFVPPLIAFPSVSSTGDTQEMRKRCNELTGGGGRSQIIRRQESLVLVYFCTLKVVGNEN